MTISQFPLPEGGIPTGNTAARPASPSIGDVFYNGEKAILEIYDGTNWVPCSAPAATPTIAVADVGTSVAYGSAQGAVTITPGTSGGPADSYLISASTGGYTATTTGTTVTITVGNNGSWTFSGQGINNFGTSVAGPSVTQTLTTVPQAPTIGSASTSSGTTTISVSWTLGNNGGKNLTAITITPYLNGTTAQTATTAATTTATSATITGLTQGSSYTFKVKVANANGDSLESSASNSVTVPTLIQVDYLVVAGGGAGGGAYTNQSGTAGGAGAGGLRSTVTATGGGGSVESAIYLSRSTNYTVTIGAGGTASQNSITWGANGNNSVFSSITSTAGGGGGGGNPATAAEAAGRDGGSGGGNNNGNGYNPGAGTQNQGYGGGTGNPAGGGGGAGGSGQNGTSGQAGNGGAGVAVSITGSSVTYAAGGGGGGAQGTTNGNGGSSSATGGNGGANLSNGQSGFANTGGGGGSSGAGNSGATSVIAGNGGSGVVILRWLTADGSITVGAGLTADATGTSGSYSYKKFTAGTGNVSFA
jgi:hypothetical protein